MTVPPAVSILTPATRPAFLPALYERIRAQDVAWEWLVQLDGPAIGAEVPDGSWRGDERVLVEHNPKPLGSGATRNLALMRARAARVLCVDDDDLLHPTALGALVAALDAEPDCFAAWGRTDSFTDDPAVHERFRAWTPGVIPAGTFGAIFERGAFPVHVGSCLWRRSHLVAFGGYAALGRSIDTNVFLAAESLFPCVHVDVPVYLYRMHPGQMTTEPGYIAARERHHAFNRERAAALRALLTARD